MGSSNGLGSGDLGSGGSGLTSLMSLMSGHLVGHFGRQE